MTAPVEAKAFWVAAPGKGEIRASTLAEPAPGEVLVRTLFTAISRGTEALVFSGRVPPSEHERMRAPFQEGAFPAPVKYGYQNVGVVVRGDAALEGVTVFSLFPHQTWFTAPSDAVHRVPPDVPPGRAVLAANMETAINGVWDAEIRAGDRVVVMGAGTVGCAAAWLAGRIPGCEVQLVDTNPDRASTARALGVGFARPETAMTEADVVLHTSGTAAGLRSALAIAAHEATIVELSWYGDTAVTLPLGEGFHAKRLRIRSSQVGHLPPSQLPRWTYRRRMALALRLLGAPELDVLISGESTFDELPAVMSRLADAPGSTICHRIKVG